VRKAGATWLVVGGEAVILPELDAALSHEARERLLGPVVPWDVRLPEAELAARVQAQVEAREADARRALATRLAEPMHAGRTVRGLEDALAALRRGSVSELVLSTAFPAEAEGWACISCRGFGDGDTPAVCPDCGRATTSTVSLREELGHQALARGARVRIVEGGDVPAFDAQGGIGAVLRFP
jgi:peptide subunit release factor 1 (eRF1)